MKPITNSKKNPGLKKTNILPKSSLTINKTSKNKLKPGISSKVQAKDAKKFKGGKTDKVNENRNLKPQKIGPKISSDRPISSKISSQPKKDPVKLSPSSSYSSSRSDKDKPSSSSNQPPAPVNFLGSLFNKLTNLFTSKPTTLLANNLNKKSPKAGSAIIVNQP